jgi:hypothetical protein
MPNLDPNVFPKLLRLRTSKAGASLIKLRLDEDLFFSFGQRYKFLVDSE